MHPIFEVYMKLVTRLYEGYEKTLEGLSIEALDWTSGPDMNSLCVQVVHITGSTRFLMGELVGGIPANRDRASEFRASGFTEAALKARLAESREFVRGVLDKLTLDELTVAHPFPSGDETFTYAEMILHVLDHTGLHLGHAQITRQLWDQQHG